MSYCKSFGKDKVIFVTKQDHEKPSTVQLPDDPDEERSGLILPNGEINWSCPCLGGMATGPCGPQFREAFSCFHYSTNEAKGSECFEHFRAMQECMRQYPNLYPMDKDDDDDDNAERNVGEDKQDTLPTSEVRTEPSVTSTQQKSVVHS